jgi:integrase
VYFAVEPNSLTTLSRASYQKFIPPSVDELSAMIAAAEPHIQRVIIIGSQLGVRVGESELLKMRWDCVDFKSKTVCIEAAKKNPHEQWRTLPLRQNLARLMEKWHIEDARNGVQYVISYKGEKITTIKTAWKKTLQRAGITRRIRPYDLRHAFATEALAAGVDVGVVAKLMGHTSPTMILNHYQHVMDSQKRAAMDAMPDIPHVHICA